MRYRAYGHALDSELELPQLERADDAPADIRFTLHGVRAATAVDSWRWHQQDASGGPFLSIARRPHDYLLRFWDSADFVVALPDRVDAHPGETVARPVLEHLLLDQVLPRMLSARGATVLHASAVVLDGVAVAFAAPSGGGKSTLARAYGQDRATVITDDALLLRSSARGVDALASYRGVRLREADEALPKRREHTPFVAGCWPLGRVYLLLEDERIAVEQVTGAEGVMALTEQGFYLDAYDEAELRRGFETKTAIAERGLVRRLRFPRSHERLDEVRRAIRQDLRSG